jgi:DnaJ-class molecular chaperone
MIELFFRDGSRYSGLQGQHSFSPVKGVASVPVYPPCPRCDSSGKCADPAGGSYECRRCNGSGHELTAKAVRVYTKERLSDLNKRARQSSLSAVALKETKREFSQFLRDRGILVERIQGNAHRNPELQSYYAMILSGSVLSPSQIRRASEVLRTLPR